MQFFEDDFDWYRLDDSDVLYLFRTKRTTNQIMLYLFDKMKQMGIDIDNLFSDNKLEHVDVDRLMHDLEERVRVEYEELKTLKRQTEQELDDFLKKQQMLLPNELKSVKHVEETDSMLKKRNVDYTKTKLHSIKLSLSNPAFVVEDPGALQIIHDAICAKNRNLLYELGFHYKEPDDPNLKNIHRCAFLAISYRTYFKDSPQYSPSSPHGAAESYRPDSPQYSPDSPHGAAASYRPDSPQYSPSSPYGAAESYRPDSPQYSPSSPSVSPYGAAALNEERGGLKKNKKYKTKKKS